MDPNPISLFTDLLFPSAVAGFLLVVTSRKVDRMQTTLLKLSIYIGLIMGKLDIDVPGDRLRAAVELLRKKESE